MFFEHFNQSVWLQWNYYVYAEAWKIVKEKCCDHLNSQSLMKRRVDHTNNIAVRF